MIAAGNYDYSDGCGKFYSPECYWAKMAHVLNSSPELSADAYTSIELCDWIAATLCGITDPKKAKLNERLSAIKQMWSHQRQAFPDDDFMAKIHPALPQLIHNMSSIMAGADSINGYLCDSWAQQIGLTAGIPVAVGNIDSYAGGVGAGIAEGTMILNLGTSACFLSVVPPNLMSSQTIPGVFAMAHDSILPNYIGIETGLSAFGDVFAWFKNLIGYNRSVDESEALLSQLTADAEQIYRSHTVCPIATDHLNGRRAPQPEPSLRGVITGLSLATSAPEIFYSLAEAAAFATRRVIDHLVDNGVPIERLVAIGGISKKSSFVMQMLADVLGREIAVAESSHACSRGSAIHAAVIAGIYHSVAEAADRLKSPIMKTYLPDYTRKDILNARYSMYLETSSFAEQHIY
jgi:L-ribulokinase